jgi:1,4-alpha-glucan branching enzyme
MEQEKGYLCLVLHAHLPYVRHPEYDRFLEEDWLYEAIIETYLPLLEVFERLVHFRDRFRITMSMSPTLTTMLTDPLLQDRFVRHVERLIELSEKEAERTRWMAEFHPLARGYLDLYKRRRAAFLDRYDRDLVQGFRRLQDEGVLEIVTCGATHGFLPLMLANRNLWRGQILVAARDYERRFGRPPRGIWLPECGYDLGVEEILKEAGIGYFFVDTHGVLHASPRPKYGVYAPIVTPNGVAAFGRDQQSSQQVWSSRAGYPGDYDYREFYRDVGWDLDYDYVRPYLHADGNRSNLGIKYYRITGPTNHKTPYRPEWASEKAARHAGHFLGQRMEQAESFHRQFGRPCFIVAPFDAELFGHWWFEGPQWLDYLLRKTAHDQTTIQTVTASEALERCPEIQVAAPSVSSWGYNGFAEQWLDGANDWLYPHQQLAGDRMVRLANRYRDREAVKGVLERALDQAARELLLAQSSDWAFILKTGSMTEYAARRVREHIGNFNKLYHDIDAGKIDEGWLATIEERNNLFPEMDYSVYADPETD